MRHGTPAGPSAHSRAATAEQIANQILDGVLVNLIDEECLRQIWEPKKGVAKNLLNIIKYNIKGHDCRLMARSYNCGMRSSGVFLLK
jgi:hypothetical protein